VTGPRPPRVVAFDLGGVLVDVDKAHLFALGPADAVDAAFFGPHHDAATVGDLDAAGFAAAMGRALRDRGVDVDDDDVGAEWARVVAWRPGGAALLSACAGVVTTHVWSNTDPIHWRVLGAAIDGVVHHAAASFRLGAAKPDARFYARALLGHAPGDVLFLDDRADNVAGARALGIDAVVVTSVDAARALLAARGVGVGVGDR
jgi:FMN phosphatase YigB (HAD superfamily)